MNPRLKDGLIAFVLILILCAGARACGHLDGSMLGMVQK